MTHNLKAAGSNPAPATKILRVIKRLSAALRGGVCVCKTRGSTVEARGREVLGKNAKTHNLALTFFSSPPCGFRHSGGAEAVGQLLSESAEVEQ